MTHEHQPGADQAPEHESQTIDHGREQEPAMQPKIWVGSLLDYNNGHLHGDWIDAAQDDEVLSANVRRILAASPTAAETGEVAEEFGIFDYDEFGDWKPGEYESLTIVAAVARGIRQHGPAFAAWAELHDAEPDMLAAFEDAYLGEYDSPEAWAEHVMDETGSREAIERLAQEEVGSSPREWCTRVFLVGAVSYMVVVAGLRTVLASVRISRPR